MNIRNVAVLAVVVIFLNVSMANAAGNPLPQFLISDITPTERWINTPGGGSISFNYMAEDINAGGDYGLVWMRIYQDGSIIAEEDCNGAPQCQITHTTPVIINEDHMFEVKVLDIGHKESQAASATLPNNGKYPHVADARFCGRH